MLRRVKEQVLINSLASDTVVVTEADNEVYVKGYGVINIADIHHCAYCCTDSCTEQETEITVSIPDSCECPYEWTLTVQAKQGDTNSVFGGPIQKIELYSSLNADGTAAADATEAATNIAAAINGNPYSIVTATSALAVLTITEKDCSKTKGFDTFISKGTVTVNQPHVDAILDAEAMAKTFPVNWGHQGSMHDYPIRGAEYCAWTFHLRSASPDQQNIDMDRSYLHSDREVTFYVNSSDANYAAYWVTKLTDGAPNADFATVCVICNAQS